jgi:sugar phosphate permease
MGNIATKREIQEHFKNPYIWLLGLCYFSVMCIFWANLTWLPSYFIKEKGFTVFKSGIMSAFPYLTGIVGLLCGGYITDKFMKTGRTVYGFVCLLIGPPVVFYALGATGDVRLILAFSISMFFIAGAMGQFWALTIDLFSVKLAGISSGIMSFIGYFGALVTPVLIGRIYDLTNSFYWGFGSATSVNFIGVIILIPLMRYEHRVHKAKVLIEGAVSNAEM